MPKTVTDLETQQIIRDIALQYAKHMNARNVDKLLAVYADDACILAPFKPMVKGLTAIRQSMEEMFKEFDPRNVVIETQHVEFAKDLAFSVGTFSADSILPTGKHLNDHGKWVTTLRQVAPTEWKIVSHIYNTDLPITDFLPK